MAFWQNPYQSVEWRISLGEGGRDPGLRFSSREQAESFARRKYSKEPWYVVPAVEHRPREILQNPESLVELRGWGVIVGPGDPYQPPELRRCKMLVGRAYGHPTMPE